MTLHGAVRLAEPATVPVNCNLVLHVPKAASRYRFFCSLIRGLTLVCQTFRGIHSLAACGGILELFDWSAVTPALDEIREFAPGVFPHGEAASSARTFLGAVWFTALAPLSLHASHCRQLCCLTFELSGRRRVGARPARQMICLAASRAWGQPVDAPLERGVRPHWWQCVRGLPWRDLTSRSYRFVAPVAHHCKRLTVLALSQTLPWLAGRSDFVDCGPLAASVAGAPRPTHLFREPRWPAEAGA